MTHPEKKINPVDIVVFLKNSNTFKYSHLNTVAFISKLLIQKNFKKNDVIVTEGDFLPGIYILYEGTVSIDTKLHKNKAFINLEKNTFFGIHCAIQDLPSHETIIAKTDVVTFLLPKKVYKNIVSLHYEIARGLLKEVTSYLCRIEKENMSKSQ